MSDRVGVDAQPICEEGNAVRTAESDQSAEQSVAGEQLRPDRHHRYPETKVRKPDDQGEGPNTGHDWKTGLNNPGRHYW